MIASFTLAYYNCRANLANAYNALKKQHNYHLTIPSDACLSVLKCNGTSHTDHNILI
jgi:hypothetical protein